MDSIIKSGLKSDLELTVSGSIGRNAKSGKTSWKNHFQPEEPFTVMENLFDFLEKQREENTINLENKTINKSNTQNSPSKPQSPTTTHN